MTLVGPILFAACSSNSSPTGPGGGGGPVGTVTVGDIFFQSGHNGTRNPAIDTVPAGTTVTWTWASGAGAHSVRSSGSTSFPSSATKSGSGQTHTATLTTPGTYEYDCAIHGSAMTGRIVVQ
jgi:Copper binding proteins, plastocyanin/azurin family